MSDLVLLRHCWAGDRDDFPGDDTQRPLDVRGQRQAAELPERFAAARIRPGRIVSSPLVRCRASVEPLAAAWSVAIVLDDRLAEVEPALVGGDGWAAAAWYAARAVRVVEQHHEPGTTTVLCSHGELLPALAGALAGRGGADLGGGPDLARKAMAKGSAWIVDPVTGAVTGEVPAP